jgi:hypothetical protein
MPTLKGAHTALKSDIDGRTNLVHSNKPESLGSLSEACSNPENNRRWELLKSFVKKHDWKSKYNWCTR